MTVLRGALDDGTPDGHVAVVYLEADDVGMALHALGTSDDPCHGWRRGK